MSPFGFIAQHDKIKSVESKIAPLLRYKNRKNDNFVLSFNFMGSDFDKCTNFHAKYIEN